VYWSDRIPAIILAVAIVIFGIQPNWLVYYTQATITTMVKMNNHHVIANVSLDKAKIKS
jgi:NAD(P)H-quinone oxidoreductase subunit 4